MTIQYSGLRKDSLVKINDGTGTLKFTILLPISGRGTLLGDIYLVDGTFQDLTVAMQGGDRSALHLGVNRVCFHGTPILKGCRLAGWSSSVGEPVANTAHLERCTRILLYINRVQSFRKDGEPDSDRCSTAS